MECGITWIENNRVRMIFPAVCFAGECIMPLQKILLLTPVVRVEGTGVGNCNAFFFLGWW